MKFTQKHNGILIAILISISFLSLGCTIYLCDIFFKVPKIIRGYVPDFCWMFSFVIIFSCTAKNLFKTYYIPFSVTVCIFFSIAFEFMQKSGIIDGTFDIFDILVYAVAAISAALILKNIDKRSKKQ